MAYAPLEDYGLIGDLHSAALISRAGAVDWCCLPRFDSPAVFAALLDDARGGAFRVAPAGGGRGVQAYRAGTNILVTRFADGSELTDFMPPYAPGRPRLVRRLRAGPAPARFRLECRPAFDFARRAHELHIEAGRARFAAEGEVLTLAAPVALRAQDGAATAEFAPAPGAIVDFLLYHGAAAAPADAAALEAAAENFWRGWLARGAFAGPWAAALERSALTLKLLTYAPTGAIVAAPTTSLPEWLGGPRNWDYRYAWIRDGAFTAAALLRLGFREEAGAFFSFVEARACAAGPEAGLRIMYGIDGREELPEEELAHLNGYRGSRPVRVGNGAAGQLQLDIYGEYFDAVALGDAAGLPVDEERWRDLAPLLERVCRDWRRPDAGIWEVRGGRRHFVYSKWMCWLALERGLALTARRRLPGDAARWRRERDAVAAELPTRGLDAGGRHFVQYYGGEALDAANLLLPAAGLLPAGDPRLAATVEATAAALAPDGLVRRYDPARAADDGLAGEEGAFNLCTFWYVEALARLGRADEARRLFERMLAAASPLGLYAEMLGPDGRALGNYPQAFSHLGLIQAAQALNKRS